MFSSNIAVLDISSQDVKVFVGAKGPTGVFSIRGIGKARCEGYIGDDWSCLADLRGAIKTAFADAYKATRCKIAKVYVGLPSGFCKVKSIVVDENFPQVKKIQPYDIENLIKKGDDQNFDENFLVINEDALYFKVDDDIKVDNPLGMKVSKLQAMIAYLLCDRKLIMFLHRVMVEMGVSDKEYICSAHGEVLSLFTLQERSEGVLFCDIGYNESAVCIAREDSLIELACFSLGKVDFVNDLKKVLEIDTECAEQIVMQIETLGFSKDFSVKDEKGVAKFYATNIKEIVSYRIKSFMNTIKKCLKSFDYEYPIYMNCFFSGFGANIFSHFYEVFKSNVGRDIIIVAPNVTGFNSPSNSIAIGLVDEVIRQEIIKSNILTKLLRKVGGN